ncbi:MAG: hypothetical protein Q7K42_05465 [Candidatus Diapherotrites archaeon]|nr:hypothetical protein [Candidatus Diapherotrites archaeon]
MQKFHLGRKAFTLFTALIAFILIALVMLLIGNMIGTSKTNSEIIGSIEEQSTMQAIADLARADALQTFNYNVRRKLESYFLEPDNVILVRKDSQWNEIINDFEKQHFADKTTGVKKFAENATANIEDILRNPRPVKGYDVKLVSSNAEELRSALNTAVLDTENLVEVVDCPEGKFSECNLGTFFVTLDLSQVPDEQYEKLPQIRVENLATGRVIKEPILPRGKFRIYVPIRLFRAISYGLEQAKNSNGFFSSDFHAKIKSFGLGMCQEKNCSPKNRLESGFVQIGENKICPGASGIYLLADISGAENNPVDLPFYSSPLNPLTYSASDPISQSNTFVSLIKKEICVKAETALKEIEGMQLIPGNTCGGEANILDVQVSPKTFPTTKVSGTVSSVSSLGFGTTESTQPIKEYELNCTKASSINVRIGIREQDEGYIVDKSIYKTPEAGFKIEIIDTYEPENFNKWSCNATCVRPTGKGCETASCSAGQFSN